LFLNKGDVAEGTSGLAAVELEFLADFSGEPVWPEQVQ
jgi:hypothetical protein